MTEVTDIASVTPDGSFLFNPPFVPHLSVKAGLPGSDFQQSFVNLSVFFRYSQAVDALTCGSLATNSTTMTAIIRQGMAQSYAETGRAGKECNARSQR